MHVTCRSAMAIQSSWLRSSETSTKRYKACQLSLVDSTPSTCLLDQRQHLARHQHPAVEVEDHRGVVVVARLTREIPAGPVLRRDRPYAQRADVAAARQLRAVQNLAPGIDGVARKGRGDGAAARGGGGGEGVGEPVEGERGGGGDHAPAIDEPALEAALRG